MDPSEERGSKVFSALQAHRGEAFHSVYKGSCASFSHTRIVSAAGQSQSRNQAPPTMEMHADDRLRRLGPGLVWVARFAG